MDAVEHNLYMLTLIDPWPEAPIGFAMNLDGGVGGCAQPTVVHQEASATDAGVPAHLLIHGDLHLCAFCQFNAADRLCIFVGKRFLTQQVFPRSRCLFNDGDLLCRIDSYVDDLDIGLTQ